MKPLLLENQDTTTLAELGRASLQIVHDLKNQINGLKLYATFLRKRMERSERPLDERETVTKLISGLDRAAGDMTTLVRLGRPIQLRRSRVDLSRIVSEVLRIITESTGDEAGFTFESDSKSFEGDFDAQALSEAIKAVTEGAISLARSRGEAAAAPLSIHLMDHGTGDNRSAIIEWRGVIINDGADPFHALNGSAGLRLALAAKIIEAHGGSTDQEPGTLRVRLGLNSGTASVAAS
jgi:nitrogen fixation/metabolism regulation signal transduction histidine kinase